MLAVITFILAQTTGGGADIPFLDFINLGVLAVLVAAILKQWLVPGWAYKEQKEARDKAEDQVIVLRDRIENEVLPKLWEVAAVLGQVVDKRSADAQRGYAERERDQVERQDLRQERKDWDDRPR